jgi:hypothetical protein
MRPITIAFIFFQAIPVLAGRLDKYDLPDGSDPQISEIILDMNQDGDEEHCVLFCKPTEGEGSPIWGRSGEVFLRMYLEEKGGILSLAGEITIPFAGCPPDALRSESVPGHRILVVPERGMHGDSDSFFFLNDGQIQRMAIIEGQKREPLQIIKGNGTGYTFKDGGETLIILSNDPDDKLSDKFLKLTATWNGDAFIVQKREKVPKI